MAGGRPSIASPELTAEICEHIAQGESLTAICAMEGMPSKTTVYRWLEENEEFRENYTRAREDQAHTFFDEITDISAKVITGELDPQSARVVIDARKWQAGKLRPKVYGDKTITENTNISIGPSLQDMTDEQLFELARRLLPAPNDT